MSKIIVLGDADTVLGFKLAGVAHAKAIEPSEADQAVMAAMTDPEAGILIVTQDCSAELSSKTRKEISANAKPVFIEIPGKRAVEVPGQRIADLVKKAIGMDLK